MKIFLTGGTGFIGSNFINHAHEAGHEILALRRSAEEAKMVILKSTPQWLTKEIENVSVEDLQGYDALVHFAAVGVSPKPASWNECFEFNVGKSLQLLQKAHEAGVSRMVVSGTFSEYGKSGLRYKEIPSNAPLEPTDPYAASKAAASVALTAYARNNKYCLYYGRIFSAFGQGQYHKNFWPDLRRAALAGEDFPMTEGGQIRDFIAVEDVAEIFLQACTDMKINPGEPVVRNVASGKPVMLAAFAAHWWEHWGATGHLRIGNLPYRAHEVMRYVPQI